MQQSRAITRKSASNLALAFFLLPPERRQAMTVLYAFCREIDDIADEESVPAAKRSQQLTSWREELTRAFDPQTANLTIPVIQELQPVLHKYGLERRHFEALIDGVEMDLSITRYADYEELELYCYRVASVVGLLSLPIFGYRNPACKDYAIYLGKALQLTNILRDVETDAQRGRIYLPASELRKFQVTPDEILSGSYSARYHALACSVAQKARQFYKLARTTLPETDRRSMSTAEMMGSVYWRLLRKLERREFRVFGGNPVRLGKPEKLWVMAHWWLSAGLGGARSDYGIG